MSALLLVKQEALKMSIRQLLNARHFGNVQAVVCSNPPQQSMRVGFSSFTCAVNRIANFPVVVRLIYW